MRNVLKKIAVLLFVIGTSFQAFAAPLPPLAAPEIDGSLGLQVLALGAGLAFLVKRKKK